jgi:hypothetical protein
LTVWHCRRRKISKRPSILKWLFFCSFHDVHDFHINNGILRILLLHSATTWRWRDGPIVQWCQAVSTWRSALKSALANVTWRRLWCDGDDSYHLIPSQSDCQSDSSFDSLIFCESWLSWFSLDSESNWSTDWLALHFKLFRDIHIDV